jgi:MFS transporter, UMF1 family
MIRAVATDATSVTASPVPEPPRTALSPTDQAHNRSRRGVASWALYDLANTIFSFNVVSYVLPIWVLAVYRSLGRTDGEANLVLGVTFGVAMLLNAVVSPIMGAVSDIAGVRKPFLLVFTALCVLPTLVIGFIPASTGIAIGDTWLWLGLGLFAIANFAYQAALIYYDAMLPLVSTPTTRGRIGGVGIGVGYVGTIIGALTIRAVTFQDGQPTAMSFVATALLFAVFGIPLFLLIREGPDGARRAAAATRQLKPRHAWRQISDTVRDARAYPGLLRFLVARLLYTDPINTVIAFMAIYAVAAVGFSEDDTLLVLIAVTLAAIVAGFAWGFVVDRIGPRRTLLVVLGLWSAAFIGAAAVLDRTVFLVVAAIAGVALAGTWASDRVFLLRLAPPERVGQFMGLYGLAGKFSAVTGPIIWGITLALLEPRIGVDAYRLAILSQLVLMFAGIAVLRGVVEPPAVEPDNARSAPQPA